MKKICFLIIILAVFTSTLQAETITLVTYYPAPQGAFEELYLAPAATDLGIPCDIGTLYFNNDGQFMVCQDNGSGSGSWQLNSLWGKENNNIYLLDVEYLSGASWFVGIGTEIPELKLSLENDGGMLAKGTFGSGVNLSTTGAGVRLIWYPKKAAFRAGIATSNSWNNLNVGNYSTALSSSMAKGVGSTAFGSAQARGNYSTALGSMVIADRAYSTALGYATYANGENSTALNGFTVEANGNYSTVITGNRSRANGLYSTTLGGIDSVASGEGATTIGSRATASGKYSTAFGPESEAMGKFSIAMGVRSLASGQTSISMGLETIASGDNSIAMGKGTIASGPTSTAMGILSEAKDSTSVAMGNNVEVEGSTAFGMGSYVFAATFGSFVVGQFNVGLSGRRDLWVMSEPLFVIGNGSDDVNRKNAVTILKNGRVGIGTNNPQTIISVEGLEEYTDNVTALAAGLTEGAVYRTGDVLKIVY